jgi:hypothetical protein
MYDNNVNPFSPIFGGKIAFFLKIKNYQYFQQKPPFFSPKFMAKTFLKS